MRGKPGQECLGMYVCVYTCVGHVNLDKNVSVRVYACINVYKT